MSFLNFFKKQKVPKYSVEELGISGSLMVQEFEKDHYIFNGFLVLISSEGISVESIRYVPLPDGVIDSNIHVVKLNENSKYFQMGFRYEVETSFKTAQSLRETAQFLYLEDANKYADKMAKLLQSCKNQKN